MAHSDAEDRVRRDGDPDGDQRELEGGEERRVGQRLPDRREAVLERVVDDHREREREEQGEVAERERAQRVPRGGATHRASGCGARGRRRPPGRQTRGRAARPRRRQPRLGSSLSIALKMLTEATSVSKGMFPEMRTIEPNSPTALPNESAAPERIAGIRLGRTIRRNVVNGRAPSDAAASSISRSSSRRTGWTARTTKGSVTKRSATTTAVRRVGDVDAERALGSVDGEQRQPGDDRRQGERQVDDRVDDALAAEVVAHEHPGDERARDRVHGHDDQRGDERQLERGDRRRRGDLVPERGDAALERRRDRRPRSG